MIKQYFVLGRNPELSRQEIFSYLNARNKRYKEIFFEDNTLLVELPEEININELGGTLKSSAIQKEGSEDLLEAYLFDEDLVDEKKFTYATYGNIDPEVLKLKFKSEKKKAVLKHGRQRIKFQNKERAPLLKAEHYFILHLHNKVIYFGKINQEYFSKEVEYRDMNKPVRREHLAISPRLAKILINLSEAKEGNLLLDPFCGVGTILLEGLLKHINVYGTDIDPRAIYEARKNLVWLKKEYKVTNLITTEQKDARKISDKNFDAIATETPLGEVLRKKPTDAKARQIINKFERTMIPILKNLRRIKKQDAKIAITFPRIRDIRVDIEKIKEMTGLETTVGPIEESREKQFISREIVVFI